MPVEGASQTNLSAAAILDWIGRRKR